MKNILQTIGNLYWQVFVTPLLAEERARKLRIPLAFVAFVLFVISLFLPWNDSFTGIQILIRIATDCLPEMLPWNFTSLQNSFFSSLFVCFLTASLLMVLSPLGLISLTKGIARRTMFLFLIALEIHAILAWCFPIFIIFLFNRTYSDFDFGYYLWATSVTLMAFVFRLFPVVPFDREPPAPTEK